MSNVEEYSFDTYDDLDGELDAAFRRAHDGDALQTAEIEDPYYGLPEGLFYFTVGQVAYMTEQWRRYGLEAPDDLVDLITSGRNIASTILRLNDAARTLHEADPVVGGSMKLMLMPWQAFRDNLDRLPQWIHEMRTRQGTDHMTDDYRSLERVLAVSQTSAPIYLDPRSPYTMRWMSMREYLDARIAESGPWGLALIQTSSQAELSFMRGKAPDDYTRNRTARVKADYYSVDGFGFFEWIALALQTNRPDDIPHDPLLLANRSQAPGTQYPYAKWQAPSLWVGALKGDVWPEADVLLAVV